MNKWEMYKIVRRIADYIHSLTTDELRINDGRDSEPKPQEGQTVQGLFLEMHYGVPTRLWTPWGKWCFGKGGAGKWETVWPRIVDYLGAKMYRPAHNTIVYGQIGPVYGLYKLGQKPLPNPIARPEEDKVSYDIAVNEWRELARKKPEEGNGKR